MVQTCCIKNCKERQNRDTNMSSHKYDTITCVSKAPEIPRMQPIEVVNVPCIKIENESASLNNEFADEDDCLESTVDTNEHNLSFHEIPSRKKRTAYIGDFINSDMITHREKYVHIIATTLAKKNKQIKTLQRTNRRLLKKIKDLHGLLDEFHKRSTDV